MTPRDDTPAALGYRWPAEWEPHAATWVAWPHNRETWPGIFDRIGPQFAEMVRALARFEPVHVLAARGAVHDDARRQLGQLPNVTLHDIVTNDAWCRDFGPTFLLREGAADAAHALAAVDWQYNAWGGKYPPFDDDQAAAEGIADTVGCRRFACELVLEGGAIEGNGRGTILTTPSCLLDPHRNPRLTRVQAENVLAEFLGAGKILWLERGELAGDDTDGHVDQLARFVGPRTVAAAREEDPADENYEPLQANFRQLKTMTDQDGRPLEVIALPLPRAKFQQGQRLPASYCNFYVLNGAVLVPQFDDVADGPAAEILARCFPGRRVIGLPALDLAWGLGAFHCLTQQQPQT